MQLHIARPGDEILLLENTETLDTNVTRSAYFKTGNAIYPYTGAMKTIGTGPYTARLAFFTYAAPTPNGIVITVKNCSVIDGRRSISPNTIAISGCYGAFKEFLASYVYPFTDDPVLLIAPIGHCQLNSNFVEQT